ncbi:MAG: hypothetical protein ACTH6Y_13850 [Vibrio hibernica]
MTTTTDLLSYTTNLENWKPTTELPEIYPQFTATQLKNLFWQRSKHIGLSTCYRQVGKRGYVCVPVFGLWLAGQLPEQQTHTTD